MQIRTSTDNMILNEYEAYIKQKELKQFQCLKQTIETIHENSINNLKHSNFRNWFTSFIEQHHIEQKGLVVLINLFFTSQENRNMIDSDNKNQATLIYIELLHETIMKAHSSHTKNAAKTHEEAQTSQENNKNYKDSEDPTIQIAFPNDFYEIISEDLWLKINKKYEELKNMEVYAMETELINEIFELFQILNEKVLFYMKNFVHQFYESELFKFKLSQLYMKKSCLINNFWFERPEIKGDLTKKSIVNCNFNANSPNKIPKRERMATNYAPKQIKEEKDLSKSCVAKSVNLSIEINENEKQE